MSDVSLLLDWLALLIIALISITIPTYAIAVTFLGRAALKVRQQRERKVKELSKALEAMSRSLQSGLPLEALEKEIKKHKDERSDLEAKLTSLSAKGAAVIPIIIFVAALAFDSIGLLYFVGILAVVPPNTPQSNALGFAFAAIVFLVLGSAFLARTLYAIDRAATAPQTLTEFRVSFQNGSSAEKFSHSQQGAVPILVHNWGKEMAERILIEMYFPQEFQVSPGQGPVFPAPASLSYMIGTQPSFPYPNLNYPGRTTIYARSPEMHEDILEMIEVNLIMPQSPGRYDVPVFVWEKKLGKTVHQLTFEVA